MTIIINLLLSYQSRNWKQWLDILIMFTLSVLCHFQQYGSFIVAVRFIGGGNRSIQRKPPLEAVAGNIEKWMFNVYIYIYIWLWIYNTYSIQNINFVCRISLYMYIEVTLRWRTSIDKKKLTFYSTEIIYTHFKLLLLKFWITCGWSSGKLIMVYICVHIKCMYFYTNCKI